MLSEYSKVVLGHNGTRGTHVHTYIEHLSVEEHFGLNLFLGGCVVVFVF